jgi:DNA-binding transcriptional ArsR family regulator
LAVLHNDAADRGSPPGGGLRGIEVVLILNHMVQYSSDLTTAFAAVSDPTRRGILEQLGHGNATITELAGRFEMTLTGIKKHVAVLEDAGLLVSTKVGRVRTCALGTRRLDEEAAWLQRFQQMVESRYRKLDQLLDAMD